MNLPLDEKEFIFFDKMKPYLKDVPTIFDIGGNRGEYTDMFLPIYNDTICHLFEPIGYNFDYLVEKYKDNTNIVINNVGVDIVNGNKVFYVVGNKDELDGMSSLFYRSTVFNRFHHEKINIPTVSINNYVLSNKIDKISVMKIDTEGNEFNIIRGADHLLKTKSVDFIQFEYGLTWKDSQTSLKKCVNYLNQYGYTVYDFTDDVFTKINNNNINQYNIRPYDNFLATHLHIGIL